MNTRSTYIKLIRKNFFSNKLDSLISTVLIIFIVWSLLKITSWMIFVANWSVVSNNLSLFTFGSYPRLEYWRPTLWLIILIFLTLITLFWSKKGILRKYIPIAWIGMIPIGLILIGGGLGLTPIHSRQWGGLTLTLILTILASVISFPLGIVLALGRQSKIDVIHKACRIYIEVMRAVPLIAVLFFGQLLIPLFLPVGLEISRVLRAILSFSLFVAAYIAEDLRGGLQAIPKTQKEAASVLGFSPIQTMQLIVLPQAIRTAIPSLTNQVIGLLQNTSLMAILGLIELLGISRSLLANPNYIGLYMEVYVWLAFLYWAVCTIMALLSRHLEKQLTYGRG